MLIQNWDNSRIGGVKLENGKICHLEKYTCQIYNLLYQSINQIFIRTKITIVQFLRKLSALFTSQSIDIKIKIVH